MVACACQLAAGQSNQEWIAYKQKCGIPANMAYNDWVAAGSKCNTRTAPTPSVVGLDPAQQLGTALGNMAGNMLILGVHNLLYGTPRRLTTPLDPAQQQRALAAQQLNNSGIYLLNLDPRDIAGAINEFQKALQQAPNDVNINKNLQYAMRLQRESVVAGRTSDTLGNLLGTGNRSADTGNNPPYRADSPNIFNLINLDPNVVDFRGMFRNSLPGTGRSYLPGKNANALSAVITGLDAEVVDLSATAKTSIDPSSLKTQIDGVFGHPVSAEPPDPIGGHPQARDIDNIFQSPQSSVPALPSTDSKPTDTEKPLKVKIDDLFSKPAPPPHN
jgi:hypothetical protein